MSICNVRMRLWLKWLKVAKVIGVGHLILNDKKVRLEFHSNGKIFIGNSNDTRTLEYVGEPLLVETLLIFDFNSFDKHFSAWDD